MNPSQIKSKTQPRAFPFFQPKTIFRRRFPRITEASARSVYGSFLEPHTSDGGGGDDVVVLCGRPDRNSHLEKDTGLSTVLG